MSYVCVRCTHSHYTLLLWIPLNVQENGACVFLYILYLYVFIHQDPWVYTAFYILCHQIRFRRKSTGFWHRTVWWYCSSCINVVISLLELLWKGERRRIFRFDWESAEIVVPQAKWWLTNISFQFCMLSLFMVVVSVFISLSYSSMGLWGIN